MEHTTEGNGASVLARMRELEPHTNAMVHIDAAEAPPVTFLVAPFR